MISCVTMSTSVLKLSLANLLPLDRFEYELVTSLPDERSGILTIRFVSENIDGLVDLLGFLHFAHSFQTNYKTFTIDSN